MTDALGILLVALAVGACILALFAVLGALFPGVVDRTRERATSHAGRSTLLGLVNLAFFAVIIAALAGVAQRTGIQAVMIAAVLLLALLVIGLSFGLAGMTWIVGASLFPGASPLRQKLLGALALTLACATPYVGWFGLLPYAAWRGLGGFVLGWFTNRESPESMASA
jgi:hypothetical protein